MKTFLIIQNLLAFLSKKIQTFLVDPRNNTTKDFVFTTLQILHNECKNFKKHKAAETAEWQTHIPTVHTVSSKE